MNVDPIIINIISISFLNNVMNSVTFYVRKTTVSKEFIDKLMKALDTHYKYDNYCYKFEVTRSNKNLSTVNKTEANILEIDSALTPEQYADELNQFVDNIKTYMDEIA